jgi:hypothetical protein
MCHTFTAEEKPIHQYISNASRLLYGKISWTQKAQSLVMTAFVVRSSPTLALAENEKKPYPIIIELLETYSRVFFGLLLVFLLVLIDRLLYCRKTGKNNTFNSCKVIKRN